MRSETQWIGCHWSKRFPPSWELKNLAAGSRQRRSYHLQKNQIVWLPMQLEANQRALQRTKLPVLHPTRPSCLLEISPPTRATAMVRSLCLSTSRKQNKKKAPFWDNGGLCLQAFSGLCSALDPKKLALNSDFLSSGPSLPCTSMPMLRQPSTWRTSWGWALRTRILHIDCLQIMHCCALLVLK